MRFITELEDEELLPILYDIVDKVKEYLDKTKILDIRKTLPENMDDLDDDKKDEVVREQHSKNTMEILRVICKKYPKETAEINKLLWVPDDPNEQKPNVMYTLVRLPKVFVEERWIVDFFTSVIVPML